MLYDIMPFAIILFCLAGIIIIYFRKIPYISTINTQELPVEKQAETKNNLIKKRAEEKIKTLNIKVRNKFSPFLNFVEKYYQFLRGKIKKIEEDYKQKHLFLVKKQPQIAKQKIKDLLDEGERLVKEENWPEAEKRFIEVISLEPNNIDTYRSLGYLYLQKKDFQHAKETLEHVLKLIVKSQRWWDGFKKKEKVVSVSEVNSQISSIYLDLGGIFLAMDDLENALESYKKAVEVEPNNPKNLDFLIDIAIISNRKKIAEKALEDLKEVNPDNEKIMEFEAKIKEMNNG